MNNYINQSGTEAVAGCLFVLVMYAALALLLSLPVMWLWNWLMPMLFKLPTLTWIEALGLNLLCGFLFKGTNVNYKK